MEDQGQDEVRALFRCPFCCGNRTSGSLCSSPRRALLSLEERGLSHMCHKLGQRCTCSFHIASSFSMVKERKKSQKSGLWSNATANMVRDFRELRSFLGTNSVTSGNEPAPDPFLSPFLCTVPPKVEKDSLTSNLDNNIPSALNELVEQHFEERRQQAVFLQELLVSTIILDW